MRLIFRKKNFLKSEIEPNESVVRLIFHRKHLTLDKKTKKVIRIKPMAFMPKKGTNLLSILRYDNWFKFLLIRYGRKKGRERKEKPNTLRGIIYMLVSDIKSIKEFKIDVKKDTTDNQHKRHGHIILPVKEGDEKIGAVVSKLSEMTSLALSKNCKGDILFSDNLKQ